MQPPAAWGNIRHHRNQPQKCHTVTRHFTDLGSASNWLTRKSFAVHKNQAQKCQYDVNKTQLLKQDVSPCLNFDKSRDTTSLMALWCEVHILTWIAPDWGTLLFACYCYCYCCWCRRGYWYLPSCLFWGCVYIHIPTKLIRGIFPLRVTSYLVCVVIMLVYSVESKQMRKPKNESWPPDRTSSINNHMTNTCIELNVIFHSNVSLTKVNVLLRESTLPLLKVCVPWRGVKQRWLQ